MSCARFQITGHVLGTDGEGRWTTVVVDRGDLAGVKRLEVFSVVGIGPGLETGAKVDAAGDLRIEDGRMILVADEAGS